MKEFALPKSCLLRKSREFEQVYRLGTRVYGKGFTLIFHPNGLGFSRLGISLHRRLKGAVRRNRLKRIIREAFRLHREVFPPEADIVMAVKPVFAADSPEAVVQAVGRLELAAGRSHVG